VFRRFRPSCFGGVGPVRLLGRTRQPSRFRSASAFACYAGVAPAEVASADRARHRLPRGDDRHLNCTLHQVAITQIRMRASTGRAYSGHRTRARQAAPSLSPREGPGLPFACG
jgi:transposase